MFFGLDAIESQVRWNSSQQMGALVQYLCVQNIKDSGIYVGGTIEQVRSQWQKMYESVPAEYITLIFHYAQQPKSDVLATLERFMEEVVPHLDANEAPATLSKIA